MIFVVVNFVLNFVLDLSSMRQFLDCDMGPR